MDQVFMLKSIYLGKEKKIYCAFIDLKKAYDRESERSYDDTIGVSTRRTVDTVTATINLLISLALVKL